MRNTANSVCIVGCGDIGRRVARRLIASGHRVEGIVKSDRSADQLREIGAHAHVHDLDREPPRTGADQIYWFAPPPGEGREDPRLRRWLQKLNEGSLQRPGHIVYISTSGVYGNTGDDWIDESTPLNPQTDRARRRADAEAALHTLCPDRARFMILRVPGIYGPARLPRKRLQKVLPVVDDADNSEGPRWSNRIHSEDLADIALAAMQSGINRRAYNASDGNPTTMCDYFSRCAELLGLPPPPRISLAEARRILSPQMLSFLEESRRLSNRRIILELGVTLRFPTLAQGLPSCLEN